MKMPQKKTKDEKRCDDDSLFGLLSSYKKLISYFKIFISDENNIVAVHLTDNPKKWSGISSERIEKFREMRRIEIGINRLSVKYLSPQHIIRNWGSMLGIKLPSKNATIINNLDKDGFFILETDLKDLSIVIQGIIKIINLSPQKKYEIIEKCLAEDSQG